MLMLSTPIVFPTLASTFKTMLLLELTLLLQSNTEEAFV